MTDKNGNQRALVIVLVFILSLFSIYFNSIVCAFLFLIFTICLCSFLSGSDVTYLLQPLVTLITSLMAYALAAKCHTVFVYVGYVGFSLKS